MTDGHSSPVAEAPSAAAVADNTAAPVPADVRSHAVHHHNTAPSHEKEQGSSVGRLTPRPTFLDHLANSRDSQFKLDRRDSSELDRYFVRLSCGDCGDFIQDAMWYNGLTDLVVIAWPSQYGQALQVADLHADAR